jgi:uncharacterized membrane protein
MNTFTFIVIYFSIFSFFGWILESTYRSLLIDKKPINSGFLYGPFIPIYGFGALFVYFTNLIIDSYPFYIEIFIYTILATFLEYVSSFILEKIFSIKLWDYSSEKFNLKGRICLKFIFFWFILIIFYLLLLQPIIVNLVNNINEQIRFYLTVIFLTYLIIDIIFSSRIYFEFAKIFNYIAGFAKDEINYNTPDITSKKVLPLISKQFLRAIRQFPNLAKNWNKYWKQTYDKGVPVTMKWINTFFSKETGKKWITDEEAQNNDIEFKELVNNILSDPKYMELKKFHHHQHSIFHHNVQVAWLSYRLGKVLNLKLNELVKGALLHDFFLYDWRTGKPENGKLHAFEHPIESYKNAVKYFSPITPIEKDIILKHMWPLTIKPPRYLESFVVCVVDKIVATKEFSQEMWHNKIK